MRLLTYELGIPKIVVQQIKKKNRVI
uniref:Uncharacterized protein n=1 Tax=Anguilla anguilla TaxID=7936 RepID=A0A0E9RH62_ANGAN